jgi:hypothetical protein
VGYVARIGKMRNAYRNLIETPEGKRMLGRYSRRWKDNIKIDLGYGLDDRGRNLFSSSSRPDRLWGPPSLLSSGYQELFLRG